jgi:dephospho-CoA kinase
VRTAERRFLELACRRGHRLVVLDIPLLLETGAERRCDRVAVVSAPALVQAQRALRRPGMSRTRLAQILAGQMPDPRKRRRADFVIRSGLHRGETVLQITSILLALRDTAGDAWPRRWMLTAREAG